MYILGNADKNELIRIKEENKYYDEKIEIDINDNNNSHAIIAKYIKEGSKVLDVGCGSGYIGKLLKNKKCEIFGIDIDAKSLEVAAKTKVYKKIKEYSICDLKENCKIFEKNIEFDYIIFADVLEHLINPGEVLNTCSKMLSKDGEILVSIPNIAHFDVLKGITNGIFNYNKIGILDNTHIRFFTYNSFIDLITSINELYNNKLDIKKIGRTINYPDYIEKYPNIIGLLNKEDDLFVLQNIFAIKLNDKVKLQKNKECYNFDLLEKTLNDNRVIIDNYKKEINDKYDYILQLQNKITEINEYIENEIKNYNNIINQKEKELNDIKSRKIWKIINFLSRHK